MNMHDVHACMHGGEVWLLITVIYITVIHMHDV